MKAPVTFSIDADAVGWIVFDRPDAKANVFDRATQEAFATALDAAEASAARTVIVAGAEGRIFIAGADFHWLQALSGTAEAVGFSRAGQALFQRVADWRVPTVCAIQGACAGGGFELALACDWRIASDDPATRIGLPETGIGTIPGWGGCVRLPRLVGATAALDHILRGQLVSAGEAMASGMVDELVAVADLREKSKQAGLRMADGGKPPRTPPPQPSTVHFNQVRDAVRVRTWGHLPAPLAAIEAVAESWAQPWGEALATEARWFGSVTAGDICKNLIRAFFLREAAKKRTLEGWFPASAREPEIPIRQVGVVGAGVMGSGIAHWLATRGHGVVLRDVRREFIDRALGIIRGFFDEGVKRGRTTADEAAIGFGRIRTTTSWEGFDNCDLVIEAIVENVAEKQRVFAELAATVPAATLLASNTSALPIDEIAGPVRGAERTLGIHFFNPVSRMPLVELILAPSTSQATAERALAFVRRLGKSPVICRSSPGFLVTRVLFFYLNAAVQRWESGESTESIDRELRAFGWPMGPLRLIDEVGVDVTAFIFGEMAHYYPDRFVCSRSCARLREAGLLGRKNGAGRGFYRYEVKTETANDAETRALTEFGAARPDRLTTSRSPGAGATTALMAVMVDEARRCLAEGVVATADDVDFALLTGAGFPAFRGGLMHWAARRDPGE